MSTAVEGAQAQDMIDEGTATTRYWDRVPIKMNGFEGEDELRDPTVRVLFGSPRQNADLKVLKISISEGEDCSFLHTYEVREVDFEALKAEQGILVDFSNFPGKIIELLRKCVECREQETPRFQAVLTAMDKESKFQVIETNDFNKLARITLSFHPSSDEDVKQFLASGLSEMKLLCRQLRKELDNVKKQSGTVDAEPGRVQGIVYGASALSRLEAVTCARSTPSGAQEDCRAAFQNREDREQSEAEKRVRDDLEVMRTCNEIMSSENRDLKACKQEQQKQISDLECRVVALEGQKEKLEEECVKLREQSCCLQSETRKLELKVNEGKVSSIGLEDQVTQSRSQIEALESSKAYLESRCEELKQAVAKAEERAKKSEMEKWQSDQVIESFAMELQGSREKTMKKQALLLRREEQVTQLQGEMDALKKQKDMLQSDFEKLRTEALHLESTNKELMTQLSSRYQGRPEERGRFGLWPNSQQGDSGRMPGPAPQHPQQQQQQQFPPHQPLFTSNTFAMGQIGVQVPQTQPWYPPYPSPSRDSGSRDYRMRYQALRE